MKKRQARQNKLLLFNDVLKQLNMYTIALNKNIGIFLKKFTEIN